MAIQLLELSGKVGTLVMYTMNGKQVIRSLPGSVKQTKAMQARSRNFGVASRASRMLRLQLAPFLPYPKDRVMQNKFTGAISKWLGKREIAAVVPENNITTLAGFSFNAACSLRERWKVQPELLHPSNNLMQLSIPAFIPKEVFSAPEGTVSVTIQASVAAVELETGITAGYMNRSIVIPFNDQPAGPYTIDLPVNLQRGNLVITACSLQFYVPGRVVGSTILVEKPGFLPADVVEARYC